MALKIPVGKRELEVGKDIIELRDSSHLAHDRDQLQARFAQDGYLLIRGLNDRAAVLKARETILRYMDEKARSLLPGSDPVDGIINPEGTAAKTMGVREITHHPNVLAALESDRLFSFFNTFFNQPARTFDYKWLRPVPTGACTDAHYDVVYMGRGSQRVVTAWQPLGDIPTELGSLCICVGSHRLPGYDKVRATYGQMDVDRDRVTGWFTDDPLELTEKFGGQWATTDFEAGDILILGMYTMHASTKNTTNRWRLSCDTRFQPAADPIDERWVGQNPKAHYAWQSEPDKIKTMTDARREWGV